MAEKKIEYLVTQPPPMPLVFPPQQKRGMNRTLKVLLIVGGSLLTLAAAVILFLAFETSVFTPIQTVVFEPDLSRVSSVTQADLERTVEILKQRWIALGLGEHKAVFFTAEHDKIVAGIPADIGPETIDQLKVVGLVEFVDFGDTYVDPGTLVNTDFKHELFPQVSGAQCHTIMTNTDMQSVAISSNPNVGGLFIEFDLTEKGTKIFLDFTSQNVGKYLGIVQDKKVFACLRVAGAIPDGHGMIQGKFSDESVRSLALVLDTLPLPIPLK